MKRKTMSNLVNVREVLESIQYDAKHATTAMLSIKQILENVAADLEEAIAQDEHAGAEEE